MVRTGTDRPRRDGHSRLHEVTHTPDLGASAVAREAVQRGQRRVLHEAGHKLQTVEELPEAQKPSYECNLTASQDWLKKLLAPDQK